MIDVGIVGGSGYTGGELLRLLANHPEVKVGAVTSRKLAGKNVTAVHSHLKSIYSLNFESLNAKEVAERCDFVFTAVPHGTAMDWVPELLDAGTRVIDLSSDYRLPTDVFEKTYATKHRAPREAVFGMPELHPEVAKARLVGNPGCYPTGATLAVAPLANAGLVERVVYDSKSGISGAGMEPTETSHYPNMSQNVIPYKLTAHRHVPEIKQELSRLSPGIKVNFTPHLFLQLGASSPLPMSSPARVLRILCRTRVRSPRSIAIFTGTPPSFEWLMPFPGCLQCAAPTSAI